MTTDPVERPMTERPPRRARSPLSRLLLGAAAGVGATVTMSAVMALAKASGLLGEPPPKKLTRRMISMLGLRPPRGKALDVASVAGHIGYGAAMGMVYTLLPRRVRTLPGGALFGLAVWSISYMGWIPKLGLMSKPKHDRPGRPTSMILAHLVYGATLAGLRRRV